MLDNYARVKRISLSSLSAIYLPFFFPFLSPLADFPHFLPARPVTSGRDSRADPAGAVQGSGEIYELRRRKYRSTRDIYGIEECAVRGRREHWSLGTQWSGF